MAPAAPTATGSTTTGTGESSPAHAGRVLGRGQRHHQRLRRPDAPRASTCTRTRPARTGSRRRRWPSTSGCTPTSPATTSTSWPPVATSRWRSASPGRGAGRPSKRYRASGERLSLDVPVRTDDLVLTLLGRALALLPRAEAEVMAEEVGEEYGRALAAGMTGRTGESDSAGVHRSFRSALHAVADALTAHGFAAHTGQPQQRAAHHQQPLPVRRGGDRAPGDLRRRPRAWSRGCSPRCTARPSPRSRPRCPGATTCASPRSDGSGRGARPLTVRARTTRSASSRRCWCSVWPGRWRSGRVGAAVPAPVTPRPRRAVAIAGPPVPTTLPPWIPPALGIAGEEALVEVVKGDLQPARPAVRDRRGAGHGQPGRRAGAGAGDGRRGRDRDRPDHLAGSRLPHLRRPARTLGAL